MLSEETSSPPFREHPLLELQGAQLRQLQAFVQAAGDSRYTALPSAGAAAASFQASAESLVYDVLMIRVGRCPEMSVAHLCT